MCRPVRVLQRQNGAYAEAEVTLLESDTFPFLMLTSSIGTVTLLYLTPFYIYLCSDTHRRCFVFSLHLKFPNRYNAQREPSALHGPKADPFTVNELVSAGFLTNYCTVNLGPVFIYP